MIQDSQTCNQYDGTGPIIIVLGGKIHDYNAFRYALNHCGRIICADGGARHLTRVGRKPDLLVGDLDSIRPDDLELFQKEGVLIERHSPVKDYTDAELAVAAALEVLDAESPQTLGLTELPESQELREADKSPQSPELSTDPVVDTIANISADIDASNQIIMWGITGDRPDHVLANQNMAVMLAKRGIRVAMSDGRNWFYILCGPARLSVPVRDIADPSVISAIAVSESVEGLTYAGLRYPLENFSLAFGSQRGVSNEIENGRDHFEVSIRSGILMLIIADPNL